MTDDEKLGIQIRMYNAADKAAKDAGSDISLICGVECSPEAYDMVVEAYGEDHMRLLSIVKDDSLTGRQMVFRFAK